MRIRWNLLVLKCLFLALCNPLVAQPTIQLGDAHNGQNEHGSIVDNALRLDQHGDETCVDQYFEAVSRAWNQMALKPATIDSGHNPSWQEYHTSLKRLLLAGQKYGRLQPSSHLTVQQGELTIQVPVNHHGFPWLASDFDCILDPCDHVTDELNAYHRTCGIGVPLIAMRARQNDCGACDDGTFLYECSPFGVTAVFQVDQNGPRIDLYDPLRIQTVTLGNEEATLAKDISAPLAWLLKSEGAEPVPSALQGFVLPRQKMDNGLFFLEPYQPGKIPIVFVHGLLSDPLAFVNTVNELRTDPEFNTRYQVWAFNYSTGEDFLNSASDLRESLQRAVSTFDPGMVDVSTSSMVLVGHSMGGLLTRLQISRSCGDLWRAYSFRSFENVRLSCTQRAEIAKTIYFEPLPFVSKAIFLATPHNGGLRGPGQEIRRQIMAAQVQQSPADVGSYRQIKRANPLAFRPLVRKRLPTSVDMMSPSSPLIREIKKLPISSQVCVHTIYAVRPTLHWQRSDGLVSSRSATNISSHSELQIRARHIEMQEAPETICEIRRILGLQ